MTTRYFVDNEGNYIGGFAGDAAIDTVPTGSIEVPQAPEDARQVWNGSEWSEVPAPSLPVRLLSYLQEQAQLVTIAIESGIASPPAGTFAGIAQLSNTLQELARLVPVSIYAPEAYASVTALGTLPEPLETVRQTVLTMIQAEINGGGS